MFKKENGITLVALVVTIIVLLILAAVSLTMVLGENGIASKAKEAASKTEIANAQDAINRAINEAQITYSVDFIEGSSEKNGYTYKDIQKVLDGYKLCDEDGNELSSSTEIPLNSEIKTGDVVYLKENDRVVYTVTFSVSSSGESVSAVVEGR